MLSILTLLLLTIPNFPCCCCYLVRDHKIFFQLVNTCWLVSQPDGHIFLEVWQTWLKATHLNKVMMYLIFKSLCWKLLRLYWKTIWCRARLPIRWVWNVHKQSGESAYFCPVSLPLWGAAGAACAAKLNVFEDLYWMLITSSPDSHELYVISTNLSFSGFNPNADIGWCSSRVILVLVDCITVTNDIFLQEVGRWWWSSQSGISFCSRII